MYIKLSRLYGRKSSAVTSISNRDNYYTIIYYGIRKRNELMKCKCPIDSIRLCMLESIR